jgi:hypothetical protein
MEKPQEIVFLRLFYFGTEAKTINHTNLIRFCGLQSVQYSILLDEMSVKSLFSLRREALTRREEII